jgi:hypothetical protein
LPLFAILRARVTKLGVHVAEYFINVFYKLQVQTIYFIKEDGLTYGTGRYLNFPLLIRVFNNLL